MTFSGLNELQRQLRNRICAHAGTGAFREINVTQPIADDDELSFLRLVVWCYAVVNEAGRVPLRFLKDLPPFQPGDLVPEVGLLRTWATHNLTLEKESDQEKLKRAWLWLRKACGSPTPGSKEHWKACFGALCESVGLVLGQAVTASAVLDSPEDGPRLVAELARRTERDWDAYRFDEHVATISARLGFVGLDVVAFRNRKLAGWRKVVELAEDGAIDRLLALRIQGDLLEVMNQALPVSSQEVLDQFRLESPGQVGAFMLALRAATIRAQRELSASEVIAALVEETAPPRASGTDPTTPPTS